MNYDVLNARDKIGEIMDRLEEEMLYTRSKVIEDLQVVYDMLDEILENDSHDD